MPKPPDLWLRGRDQCWMTTVNGKQIKLSKDKAEARKLFHRLMAADAPEVAGRVAVRRLLDDYLAQTAAAKSPGRLVSCVRYYTRFAAAFGHRRCDSLKPDEVEAWLGRQPGGGSTRDFTLAALKAAFNWGVRRRRLAADPLAGLARGRPAKRKRVVTAAEFEAAVAKGKPHWQDYFRVLLLTGMRPVSEAARLTAGHLDRANRRAVFAEHKTAGKTGRPRVVYFPPAAWAVVERRAAEHRDGPLFRTGVGTAISVARANQQLKRMCVAAGVRPFVPYDLRHTRISQALMNGVPIDVLAALAGNSPKVIRQSYSHLLDDSLAPLLAAAAERAAVG